MTASTHITDPAPQPDPPPTGPASVDEAGVLAASIARVEHRLALLDELADIAMEMVRGVAEHSRAVRAAAARAAANDASAAAATPADAARDTGADDLAKLSRAVRLTLDLAGRLEQSLRALCSGEAKIHEARRQDREARDRTVSIERAEAAQERVIEQVKMVIAREAESEGDSCDLLAALDERLNDDIDYIALDDRPLREAVERICVDLDLKPDWSRWTDEGWPEDPAAILGARPPWSPFSRPSRKPLLYKNRDYDRQAFETIARSP